MTARGLGLLAGAVLLAGCAQPVSLGSGELACRVGDDGKPANGVVLMAQAVASASRVPCLNAIPLDWHLSDVEVRDGSGRFWLDSDREGTHVIEVVLTASCSTGKATEIPSDRSGVRRMEQVTQLSPGYQGTRFYRFDGGCLSIRFRLTGQDRGGPLAVATQGIDLLPRADVEQLVHDETGGRLELDPVLEEGGGP